MTAYVYIILANSLSLFGMVTVAELGSSTTAWSVVFSWTEKVSLSSKMASSVMVIAVHSSVSPG